MTSLTATLDKLERLTTAPKPWLASVTYRCGFTRSFRAPTRQLASAWCDRLLANDVDHAMTDCSVFHSPEVEA